ncbi:putative tRNA methyltransferase domain-containing protein [Neospora caninum Liverpool]|nr:putative tRNA methyltransferase domain-containing protein [Neospora caninum Liverpool]CBZ54930.1 putative tRNA methyltransferase domain-containing protein [Neospora caninum Liverpool]|eukprot:XP_003884958.1 putative tRNA methyltransferase domain-containing protein [Neospora caninum Liverpool]
MTSSRDEGNETDEETEDNPRAWERVEGCSALVHIRVRLQPRPSQDAREPRDCALARGKEAPEETPKKRSGFGPPSSPSPFSSSCSDCHSLRRGDGDASRTPLPPAVGLTTENRGEVRVDLRGWSDSLLVRGWLSVLVAGLKGCAPETVLALTTDEILREAGLKAPSTLRSPGKEADRSAREPQEEGRAEGDEVQQGGEEDGEREERRRARDEEKRRLVVPQGLGHMLRSIQRQVRVQLGRLQEEKTGCTAEEKVGERKNSDRSHEPAGPPGQGEKPTAELESVPDPRSRNREKEAVTLPSSPLSSPCRPRAPPSSLARALASSSPLSSSSSESSGPEAEARRAAPPLSEEIAVLLSGGVDSSVSLRLLQQRGFSPRAFFIKIWLPEYLLVSRHLPREDTGESALPEAGRACGWRADLTFAEQVCRQARVPLEVLPLQEAYWEGVVKQLLDEARQGLTPNPDWWCNQRVKFGAFLDLLDGRENRRNLSRHNGDKASEAKNAERPSSAWSSCWTGAVASGHYARVVHDAEAARSGQREGHEREDERGDRRTRLLRGKDRRKDQSYFLSGLSQRQLRRLLTPVGDMEKVEVRRLAAGLALPTASRRDSQGLCFLGKLPLSLFFQHFLGSSPGPVLHFPSCLALGTHGGLWNFTVGQRKGVTPCIDVGRIRKLSSRSSLDSRAAPFGNQQKRQTRDRSEQSRGPGELQNWSPASESSVRTPGTPNVPEPAGPALATSGEEATANLRLERNASKRESRPGGADPNAPDRNRNTVGLVCTYSRAPPTDGGRATSPSSSSAVDGNEVRKGGRSRLPRPALAALLSETSQNVFGSAHPLLRGGRGATSLAGRWVVAGKHPPSNALFVVSEKEMKDAAAVAESVGYSLEVLAAGAGVDTAAESQATYLLAFLLTLQQKFLRVDDFQWISGAPPLRPLNAVKEEHPWAPRASFLHALPSRSEGVLPWRQAGDEKEDGDLAFLRWALEGTKDRSPRVYDVQVRHAAGSACAAVHRNVRLCLFPPEKVLSKETLSRPSVLSYHSKGSRAERTRWHFGDQRSSSSLPGVWTAWIELHEPDEGLAPGQIAALYEGEECLGAGRISPRQGHLAVEAALRAAGLS